MPLAKEQVTPPVTEQVTGEVTRLLAVMSGDMRRLDIQAALKLKHEDHFRAAYLIPAMDGGFIEMTIPDKPKSSKQKYRLTDKGKKWVEQNQAETAGGKTYTEKLT